MNEVKKFLSSEQGIRASFVVATGVVQEMQSIQNTFPIASLAVGRAMVAAALMGSLQKKGQMVSLHFKGDGPLGLFLGEGSFDGEVRGYTQNPKLELEFSDKKLHLGPAIGQGLLTVVRTVSGQAPQRGSVEIQTGEVGDDVAYFLHQSDQIESIVNVGVKVNAYGKVEAAGGVLVEKLPNASSQVADLLLQNLQKVSSVSELIASGQGCEDLKQKFLKGINVIEVDHPYQLNYTCRCSKNRFEAALELFEIKDLEEMAQIEKGVEAKCEFCGRSYNLSHEAISSVLNSLKLQKMH